MMQKTVHGLFWAAALCLAALAAPAQEAEPVVEVAAEPRSVEQLQQELKATEARRREISAKLRSSWADYSKSPQVSEAREAAEGAEKAYSDAQKKDPALLAARRAQVEATLQLQRLVEAAVASQAEGSALQKRIAQTEEKKQDLMFQQALARFKLTSSYSPVQRKLDRDPGLRKMKAEAGRDKEALKAYQKARQARRDEMPEAKELLAEMQGCREQIQQIDAETKDATRQLNAIRSDLSRSKDPEVAAARQRQAEASKAVQKALVSGELAEVDKARDAARQALNAKVAELMKGDETAVALRKELDQLTEKARDLGKQIRAAARKKPD